MCDAMRNYCELGVREGHRDWSRDVEINVYYWLLGWLMKACLGGSTKGRRRVTGESKRTLGWTGRMVGTGGGGGGTARRKRAFAYNGLPL